MILRKIRLSKVGEPKEQCPESSLKTVFQEGVVIQLRGHVKRRQNWQNGSRWEHVGACNSNWSGWRKTGEEKLKTANPDNTVKEFYYKNNEVVVRGSCGANRSHGMPWPPCEENRWEFIIRENKSVHTVTGKSHTSYPIILSQVWTKTMDHQEHDENKQQENRNIGSRKTEKADN